jgi:hypothetical protein
MSDVTVDMALEYAQKLCVHSGSFVHLYETNVVTSGELVVEITNTQLGMGNVHSALPCSAGIIAAVLACVDLEREAHGKWREEGGREGGREGGFNIPIGSL